MDTSAFIPLLSEIRTLGWIESFLVWRLFVLGGSHGLERGRVRNIGSSGGNVY